MVQLYQVTEDRSGHNNVPERIVAEAEHPPEGTPILRCEVEIAPKMVLKGRAWGDHVFITDGVGDLWAYQKVTQDVEPFFTAKVLGNAYQKTKVIPAHQTRDFYYRSYHQQAESNQTIEVPDDYDGGYDYQGSRGAYQTGTPWNYLDIEVTCQGVTKLMPFKFRRPTWGTATLPEKGWEIQCHNDFFGLPLDWTIHIIDIQVPYLHYGNRGTHQHYGWSGLFDLFMNYEIEDKQAFWGRFLEGLKTRNVLKPEVDTKGIKGVAGRKGIRENLDRLQSEEPVLWDFWLWLHNSKVREGTSNNSLMAAFLKECGKDYETLVTGLRETMDFGPDKPLPKGSRHSSYYRYDHDEPNERRALCLALPGAKEKRREQLAQKDWSLRKGLASQAEGLGVTKETYPKLFAAIENKDVPLSVFHQPGTKQPVNTEFDLWERALKQPGWAEPIFQIAKDAARRSTYEKDITPYLAFLFHIPKYLDRNTEGRKKWRAMPKYVSSQWELEMGDEAGESTTSKRSALTPVADNEERVLTVPYAAMAISGVQTTYCYSLRYYVLEENQIDPESGSPIVNELERKLNGRDDYGLMYYTLTGTARNRGYPAFLIIFERLKRGTRVHFHRVHPCRSKQGVQTPGSKLIEECYRYMAGNVRAEEIHAQQGDLIFIRNETQQLDWEVEGKPVKDFESHAFVPPNGKPILLIENTAKSVKNRLGFIHCDKPFKVDHPEHDPLTDMPAGTYEVRRCKSWEANPKSVWTLTID